MNRSCKETWIDRLCYNIRNLVAAYLYKVTGDQKRIEFVGGIPRMNEICSQVETQRPLPDRGVIRYQHTDGRWVIENFMTMALCRALENYVFFMGELADADRERTGTP